MSNKRDKRARDKLKKKRAAGQISSRAKSRSQRAEPSNLNEKLSQAIGLHKNNKPKEAEPIYRQVLAEHPDNVDALHFLGILLSHQGNSAEGEKKSEKPLSLIQITLTLITTSAISCRF